MKKFNLSEKRLWANMYREDDVKEFISRLKKECDFYKLSSDIKISIDKLAGKYLIEND